MRYTKVHLHNGEEFALTAGDFKVLRDLMIEPEFQGSSSPYFVTSDMDGAEIVLNVEAVSCIRLITPDVRKSWIKHEIQLQMEQQQNRQEAQKEYFTVPTIPPDDFRF